MVNFIVKPALQMLLLLLVFSTTKAQDNLIIDEGQAIDAGSEKMSTLMVWDNENYYTLRLNDKGTFEINTGSDASIEIFDKKKSHISTIPIRCTDGTKFRRFEPVSFIKTTEGFILLARNYSISQKLMKSFIFKISDEGFIIQAKSIGEIEGITVSNEKFDFFRLDKTTQNDEMRIIYSQVIPPDINFPERINFIIYDENLNISGERLLNFPEDILDYLISDMILSETGLAFFRIETNNPYLLEKTIHQLIIYDIFNDKTQNYEFSPEGGAIAKARLKKVNENTVGFFGYYTQKHDDPKPKGLLYYLFDAHSGKLLRNKIYELPAEIREKINVKNLSSNSEYEHFKPQELHIGMDNQVFLLFEFYWKKLMIVQDREGKPWTTPYYYANEIIVFTFDQSDEFVSAGILPKEQLQSNDFGLMGFSSFAAKNEVVIIFNDNPKNVDEYKAKNLKTMKSGFITMIAEYNFQKASYSKKILPTKNARINFDPGVIYKTNENSVIFLNHSKPFNLMEIRF